MPTPTQMLAEQLIGHPLYEWIQERRQAGRSWRLVSRDLLELTAGKVDVTGETIRGWVAETERISA